MQDEIRAAAFRWLEEQTALRGDALPRRLIEKGFDFRGDKVTLVGPSGIWKPRGFETVPLSITSTPKGPYDDSMSPDGLLIYRYRVDDPNRRDNVGLRQGNEDTDAADLLFRRGCRTVSANLAGIHSCSL